MWCPEEEKNEKEKREEKSMPALFNGNQPPIWYEMHAAYNGKSVSTGTDADHYDRITAYTLQPEGDCRVDVCNTPTVNVSIQRLEKADIVCRRRDDKDQRIMRVYLTENGKKNRGGTPAGKQSCGESDVQQFQRSGAMSFTKVFWADSG